MDSFITFNLIEGAFWILLSVAAFALSKKLDKQFRAISTTSAVALLLFGISDIIEFQMGSFLEPHLWWLYAWKIIIVGMFLFIIVWYFKLSLWQKSV
jgi:hypothetical protein